MSRYAVSVCFAWTAVALCYAADKPETKPLSPVQARQRVGEKVTVEMMVVASKDRLEKHKEIYLDSEADFRSPKNLAVVITVAGAAKFKEAGIADPAGYFKGKTIRVAGTVTLDKERPRIMVGDAKQIEVIKKN
jgi:DNA/RNA endonuclease YhcR with UshA esterase domain